MAGRMGEGPGLAEIGGPRRNQSQAAVSERCRSRPSTPEMTAFRVFKTFAVCVIAAGAAISAAGAKGPPAGAMLLAAANTEAVPAYGRIETTRIHLERTEKNLAFRPEDLLPAKWTFPGMKSAEVMAFFEASGIKGDHLAALRGPGVVREETNGVVVMPPRSVVLGLGREARGLVYGKLAAYPENERHRQPYLFLEADVDEWQETGLLSQQTTDLIKRVSYARPGTLCLADPQIVSEIPFFERGAFLKALSRVPTLVVKLSIDRRSDIEAMSSYWGAGGRVDEIRQVLKSMNEVEGGAKLGLSRILPPFARTRLYTFPVAPRRGDPVIQDCFWTALNFFNESPVDVRAGNRTPGDWFAANYVPASGALRFGDVVVILEEGGSAVHACVHLARNIVFTKNGGGTGSPWLLMDMDEMFRGYLAHLRPGIRLQVVAYRLKGT